MTSMTFKCIHVDSSVKIHYKIALYQTLHHKEPSLLTMPATEVQNSTFFFGGVVVGA